MKQIRKMSNLVAEELTEVLKANGVTLDESAFEEKVSEIVDTISKSIDEGGKGCNKTEDPDEGCNSKKDPKEGGDPTDDEDDLTEGAEVSEILMATEDSTIGDVTVSAGEFVEIDELDAEAGTATITVYDADGEVKNDGVDVPIDALDTFEDKAEEVEIDEEAETVYSVSEGIHIKGGKKVKISAAVEKLKAKLKAKKAGGVNKFTIKNGKIVKKSADQIAADKKKSKRFAKQMKKFAKKRVKSLKKSNKLNSGAESGTRKVVEGFDITSENLKFAVDEGDILSCENGTLSVIREGNTVLSGLTVENDFFDKCVAEGLVEEEKKEDPENPEEPTNEGKDVCPKCGKNPCECQNASEAAILTFRSDKGYVLVREGAEIPLGNRIRARGCLKNEGILVTSEQLDDAVNGKEVIL